jgi:hypothetical protein
MASFDVRSPRRVALLGTVVLTAGVVAILASVLWAQEHMQRAGSNHAVNAGAGNLGDISAHNSPTLVRNPRDRRNLVVTNRIDSPDFDCAVHVSTDAGATWRRTRVPIPKGPGRKCYAADAAFGGDGELHVAYVTLQGRGNTPSAVWVAASRDGGRTLGAPRKVAGELAFQVRIAADPKSPGRLYLSWVQAREVGTLRFTAGNPIVVARSDDGGRRWSRPVRVNGPARSRVLAPSTVVGPKGELYLLYLDVGDDTLDYEGGHDAFGGPPYAGHFTLVVARSVDRGATWADSIVDDEVVPTRRFIAFLPPFPSLAVDRDSGRLYVAFHDGRDGDPDVRVWSLAPGAGTWSGPVRVNDTPVRDRTAQYLPKLAVAPDGRVDVAYYDRRGDAGSDVFNRVSLQSSRDEARTFGAHTEVSTVEFDSRIGFGSERGLADLGSRLGLVSDDDGAVAVWSDTRSGTDASSKQDLYLARLRPSGRWIEDALRYGGIALLFGAAMVLAFGLVRRRARAVSETAAR